MVERYHYNESKSAFGLSLNIYTHSSVFCQRSVVVVVVVCVKNVPCSKLLLVHVAMHASGDIARKIPYSIRVLCCFVSFFS